MQGNDVFEPIGLDGFGIHSENYAIKLGKHPKEQAKISEKNFYRQLASTGNGFAWENRLETYDPSYYKWTQWIFIQMFKHGLAYRKKSPVNFCPKDKTVLSDEQVINGKCERCDSEVIQKELEQLRPFTMVRDLSRYVASIPRRRKAIVYIGQGSAGAMLGDRFGQEPPKELIGAVQWARRANVAVYVIDPTGKLTPGAEGYADEPGPLSFRDLARMRQDAMASFGEATGGFWGTGVRAVDLVDRIVTETRQYYLLGYYPPPPTSRRMRWWREVMGDVWARFRSIEVRTTRPGVRVRARKGYWQDDARPGENAPKPIKAGTETVRAVAEILPQSALPLRAVAVPFRGGPKAKRHPVAIAVEVTATPPDGQPERAELYAAAVEPGKGLRETDRVTARFGTKGVTDSISRYLVCARLDLAPGRYQLRLGVTSAWAQATGSVYVDVEVPDYRKELLSMSGLALDQQSDGRPMPAARTGTIAALVPSPPTLARQFAATDLVWTHVEIYRGTKAPDAPVEVITALGREGEEEAVWHAREVFPPSAFGTAGKVVSRVLLPLADLSPGAYRLRVTATTAAPTDKDEPLTVRRELDIEVTGR